MLIVNGLGLVVLVSVSGLWVSRTRPLAKGEFKIVSRLLSVLMIRLDVVRFGTLLMPMRLMVSRRGANVVSLVMRLFVRMTNLVGGVVVFRVSGIAGLRIRGKCLKFGSIELLQAGMMASA